ncbi:MAG: ATP-binding cassette domain-containing protein [Bacteroidales bacterium]|nr:ATP-binding cassette domain-containing protein [Bacteroidales bacterium]
MEERIIDDKKGNSFRWLIKYIYEIKVRYIFAALFILLSSGSFVFFSWHLSDFAARWLIEEQVVLSALTLAFAFLAGRYIFDYFSSLLNYQAGNAIVSKIKKKLHIRLLNNNQSDAISSTLMVTRVCDDLKPFFSFFIPYAIASGLVAILVLCVCFWFEFWVGLSLLVSLIVIPLLMSMIGSGSVSLHKKHINLFMRYSAVFYNRLQTIAEIVSLDNLESQHQFLSKKSKAVNHATTNVMRVAILSSAVLELFVCIAIAGVAIFLGLSLLGVIPGSNYGKGYDYRTALFLLILAPYLFVYLRKFVSAYHDKNKALASAKLLIPLLNDEFEDIPAVENEKFGTLSIADINFSYPNTLVKVLHNIHFDFPKKGLVLVKGISGSGKSTLLKILSGSLMVEDGTISVNRQSNPWSSQWLKENTSYMNQFPFIFDGTLRYNVFLDKGHESNHQYPDFLDTLLFKKEDGWETTLSHNGKQLSGGEKQLITLARMMLHHKPIAILDEPTANLDTDTVDIILEHIQRMSHSKLLILASHEVKFEAIATKVINLNWGEQMDYA